MSRDKAYWETLIARLDEYRCLCGASGPFTCKDDCDGDQSDKLVNEALVAIIEELFTKEDKL